MKNRTRTMAIGTVAAVTAGLSSVLLGAAPASATPFTCGSGGISLGGGVCQLTYDAGTAAFTPPSGTTKLEALLVGGGGDGYGYGYGGGGGQVILQNFTDIATPIDIAVGADGQASTATQGVTTATANPGQAGIFPVGGSSGNGNTSTGEGGAGAGGGTSTANGGAGQVVSALASGTSLFAGDPSCYGGGGATQSEFDATFGLATCGGAAAVASGVTTVITPAVANTGGGGGSQNDGGGSDGASGLVVVRWQVAPAPVTLAFVMNGHGSQVPTQEIIVDTSGAQPTDPAAANTAFLGWYTDPTLTTKYNFGDPIPADTTVYASWAVLATTGVSIYPWAIPGAGGALVLGLALLVFSRRRVGRARP